MDKNVLVQVGKSIKRYTWGAFSNSSLRIGYFPEGAQTPTRFSFQVDLLDNQGEFDAYRLAIRTHALGQITIPNASTPYHVDQSVRVFCEEASMPTVVTNVLEFLVLVRLESEDGISRESVLSSVAGTAGQVDRALALLCQPGGPVSSWQVEGHFVVPSLWTALQVLTNLKSI